jgi:hypothetical protein
LMPEEQADDLPPSGQRLLKRFDEACIDADPIDLLEVLFLTFARESVRLLPTFEVFMRHVEDTRRRLKRRAAKFSASLTLRA